MKIPVSNSSTVKSYEYFPEEETLKVTFLKGGTYSYAPVGPGLFREWEASKSKGSFVFKELRPLLKEGGKGK